MVDESVSATSVAQLLQEPNSALRSLSLQSAHFADFTRAFSSTNATLSSLTRLELHGAYLKETEVVALFSVLQRSADRLVELKLSGNSPEQLGCEAISTYLKLNRSLRILHLAGCDLSPSNFETLVAGIEQNAVLDTLYANSNSIGSSGGSAIAEALATKNKTLTCLDLRSNNIRFEAVEPFAKALRDNTTLLHVNLHDNWMTPAGVAILQQARAANPNTRIYFLDIGGCNEIEPDEMSDDSDVSERA
eukprot:TRINITY_DN6298_c1_g1_i1.p1 TRINITY_DN6298_c1_g1~~TRINITY_DN6298_c1_g1_i1.p1  ORF type:complete len:248 (+),score=24.89 TRINITY_DN6298_c1_g1_i1:901-1644(+)